MVLLYRCDKRKRNVYRTYPVGSVTVSSGNKRRRPRNIKYTTSLRISVCLSDSYRYSIHCYSGSRTRNHRSSGPKLTIEKQKDTLEQPMSRETQRR